MIPKIGELLLVLFNIMLLCRILSLMGNPLLVIEDRPALLFMDWKYGMAMGLLLLLSLDLIVLLRMLFGKRRTAYPVNKKMPCLQGQNHPAIPAISYDVPVVPTVQDKAKQPSGETLHRTEESGSCQMQKVSFIHLDSIEQTESEP